MKTHSVKRPLVPLAAFFILAFLPPARSENTNPILFVTQVAPAVPHHTVTSIDGSLLASTAAAPRGGDLGLVPLSRLEQAPPPLRAAVLGKNPGAVNVAAAGGAYTLVLVVAHEQAGQRDLSTPGLKQNLTDSLKGRKQQVARAAYVAAARSDAKIVNYLARRLVEGKGTLPN